MNKISMLITGSLLAVTGIYIIINSPSIKNFGAVLAITGVLTNIVVLIFMIRNEKWLSKF